MQRYFDCCDNFLAFSNIVCILGCLVLNKVDEKKKIL